MKVWDNLSNNENTCDLTVTPEYGPSPYNPMYPGGEPISDVWEVTNDQMMDNYGYVICISTD